MKILLKLLISALLMNASTYASNLSEITDEGERSLQQSKIVQTQNGLLEIIPHELFGEILKHLPFNIVSEVCKPFHLWSGGYKSIGVHGSQNIPDVKLPIKVNGLKLDYDKFESQEQIDNTPSMLFYTIANEAINMPPAMFLRLHHMNIDTLLFRHTDFLSHFESASSEQWNNIEENLINKKSVTKIIFDTEARYLCESQVVIASKLINLFVKNLDLKSLTIKNNYYFFNDEYISKFQLNVLIETLMKNKNLTEVDFVYNRMNDDQGDEIVKLLQHLGLEKLSLSYNNFTDLTLNKITSNILQSNIKNLNISSNSFTKDGIFKLLAKLHDNVNLEELNFHNCIESNLELGTAIANLFQAKTKIQSIGH